MDVAFRYKYDTRYIQYQALVQSSKYNCTWYQDRQRTCYVLYLVPYPYNCYREYSAQYSVDDEGCADEMTLKRTNEKIQVHSYVAHPVPQQSF